MTTTDSLTQLLVAAQACEDKKAEDIRILRLDPTESGLTDYFLICNGLNPRQNDAISDEIEIQLKRQFGMYANSVEGRRQGEWILLDYVDFIVHIFSAEKRAFYGLERLRKSATTISLADLHAEVADRVKAAKSSRKAPAKTTVTKKVTTPKTAKKAAKKAATKKSTAKKSKKAVSVKKSSR